MSISHSYKNTPQAQKLSTSNFYSILYYTPKICHLLSFKYDLLIFASATALKISQKHPDRSKSFLHLHQSWKRALPNQIWEYKHSLISHKLYNTQIQIMDWIELNFNQTITSRETFFYLIKSNYTSISNNLLALRLQILHKKEKLENLNLCLDEFKVKYKQIVMASWNHDPLNVFIYVYAFTIYNLSQYLANVKLEINIYHVPIYLEISIMSATYIKILL